MAKAQQQFPQRKIWYIEDREIQDKNKLKYEKIDRE